MQHVLLCLNNLLNGGVGGDRRRGLPGQVGVTPHELGRLAAVQPQQVVEDEDLPVAPGPGADADRGDVLGVGDGRAQRGRDALEDQCEASGVGQRPSVGIEPVARLPASLDAIAAHGVDRLRREPQVPHHRDLGGDEGLDHRDPDGPPLELHGVGAGPDQGGAVADGVRRVEVVAEPRKVAHEQRLGLGPGHRRGVVDHVVDGHLQGVLVAQDVVGQRVADQDDVNPGGVGDPRPGVS